MIEASKETARRAAEALPKARVFAATGFDPDFLERERIGQSQAGIFAMRDDAKNQYAASLAQVHGIPFTIAIAHEAVSVERLRAGRASTSRSTRARSRRRRSSASPTTRGPSRSRCSRATATRCSTSTTRESSRYIGMSFREHAGPRLDHRRHRAERTAIFPHGDDVLEAGDRVIIFTEAANAPWVVEAL